MIPNAVIAKLFIVAFGHVFPQCVVTMQVGDVWASSPRSYQEALRSAVHGQRGRDVRLEEKIISFRSQHYPGANVIAVTCAKTGTP